MNITREQAQVESWHRGKLNWKLHSAQKIINEKLSKITRQLFVANCSRQWGKSFWAVTKAIEMALTKPNARIKYGTAFQSDLLEFIIPTFEAILKDCPDSIRPVYKTQGSKWVFKNGAQIKLIGCDKSPNSLRGNVIDLIILDECGFIDTLEYLYTSIIVPATTHRPDCKIILISTPPATPTHPFTDFIARATMEDAYIKLDIYSNPLIDEATIERLAKELGGKNSIAFRRECLCEILVDTTIAIIPEWNDLAYTVVRHDPEPLPDFYSAIVAIDLGLNDNTGAVFGYWDFNRAKVVVQAELLVNGINSEQLVKLCREIEINLWGEDKIPMRWADGSLFTLNDICTIHKYNVVPVRKDIVEAQVNSLRLMLANGQIEILDACKNTIVQCASGIWNKQKTAFARSGHCHNDLLAALIYLVRHISRENPYPTNYNHDRMTMLYRPAKTPAHLEAFKKLLGSNILRKG